MADQIEDNQLNEYIETLKQAFSSGSIKKTKEVSLEEETDWDDNWNDNWDDEEENENDKNETSNKLTTTQLIQDIMPLFNEYDSSLKIYLITSIKALSIVEYPSLANSFIMYNDFQYLSQKLKDESMLTFVESLWKQVLKKFYEELKILIASLNLNTVHTPNSEEGILDDYNLNQLSLIYKWFNILFEEKQFKSTNPVKFKELVVNLVEYLNNYLIRKVVNLIDISEFQSEQIGLIIDNLNNVTIPYILQLELKKDEIESFNKLKNVKFLINNHLKDIMDRFYQGELYDIDTNELVKLLRNTFIQSELRDNYINEIIEFRNMN
ncbi:unnamed protein product [Candida verbasci]|uniref:Retrograde transport protein Dsl1 C-terminal domain-containing protein n=1 Tax=Candida verbasci TaxID=1227364 RepID=A0A9W4TS65_9ASCO|nr:unnamed protein product [Candida verbasci]